MLYLKRSYLNMSKMLLKILFIKYKQIHTKNTASFLSFRELINSLTVQFSKSEKRIEHASSTRRNLF